MARPKMLRDPSNFSSLDDFLIEEEALEEVSARAIKRVIALSLQQAMSAQHLTKVAMAERMNTSRRQLDRVLDPEGHENVSIETLAKAANAVGRKLKLELL